MLTSKKKQTGRALFMILVVVAPTGLSAERAGTQNFGKTITLKQSVALQDALKHPEKYSTRKILLEGRITDVCQKKGCWLMLSEGDQALRVRFEGYSFFVPKDSRGRKARVEGKLHQERISEEMARHYAAEESKSADVSRIKGPQRVVTFEASGVQIFQ
jgi:Domain of unknown function (DUF4920)